MSRPLQPCGTRAAYVRHLWRGEEPCEPCREANREYVASCRARAGALPPGGAHGLSGYNNYGCRCEVCRGAKARSNARRYPLVFEVPQRRAAR